jgi:hypothetical protein
VFDTQWGDVTVDALILPLFVDVVEAPQHFESGDMRTSIVYYALRSMFHQKLEELQGL